jgi:type IV pilus assembly protein PilC
MPTFYYQARSASSDLISDQVSADTLAQAVAQLESQGLTIVAIGTTPLPAAPPGENPFGASSAERRLATEQAALAEHLSRVIERGRDLLPALHAYAQELPSGRRKRELGTVLHVLDRGDAAQAASTLSTMPGYWIPLLGAATSSRDPGRILREFVQESERASELSRQWWLALAYPALLGGLAATVMVALSVFVIPIFRDIFSGFGLKLPAFTILVLTVADWIASGRILIWIAAIVAGWWLLWQAARLLPVSWRNWCSDRWALRWGRATALARFAQFSADLLEAELATPQAVRLAGIATGNPPIRRAADRLAESLESGNRATPSGAAVLTSTIRSALVDRQAAVNARIRLLREVSNCYSDQARRRLSWTTGVIEPLAICAIGFVVGATVIALFLPLVTLVHGLS